MSTQVLQPEVKPLTAHDRCDGCGAQAYVRVRLLEGELLFCGHHFAASEEKLRAVALEVHEQEIPK